LITGITQEPSTQAYYLVFYHEIRPILNRLIQCYEHVEYMQYDDFDKIKDIGSGGYGTVYTAKYEGIAEYKRSTFLVEEDMPQTVALKRFKNFDWMLELFISEVSNN